jgi:poly(hydroxyalkanoate) granule-associated protein
MSKTKEIKVVEEEVAIGSTPLLSGVRRVLMAGVGAVALAQEEIDEFVNKLVERGEIAEKDGRNLLADIRERRNKTQEEAKTRAKSASETLDKRMETILDRLNIPTKSDIETLSKKVTLLAEKVDALKANKK